MSVLSRTPSKRRYNEPHDPEQEWTTLKRCRIQEDLDFRDRTGLCYRNNPFYSIPYPTIQIFRDYNVSKATGYRILQDKDARRRNNSQIKEEARGRKRIISPEQIRQMEDIIQNNGMDGRTLTFAELGIAIGSDAHPRTIQNYLGDLNYHRCIACRTGWVSPRTAQYRKKWAEDMLRKYPRPEDWYRVRFSDEVHFGFGPEGIIRVIRKPGERKCADCVIEKREPREKDIKRLHAWAAIGHDFKSELYFYDVPGNSNSKMTHKVYAEILKNIVKPWVNRRDDFVLEEDSDSGYGYDPPPKQPKLTCMTYEQFKKSLKPKPPSKPKVDNLPTKLKKQYSIETYKNCATSPDLAVIKCGWTAPKRQIRGHEHWDIETTRELALERWASLSINQINF